MSDDTEHDAPALTAPTGEEPEYAAIPLPDGTAPLILVLGGTGYIGGRLTPRLLAAGYRVRLISRDLERLRALPWSEQCDLIEGSADDPEAMRRATEGVDVVYYLVHSMGGGKNFEDDDLKAARTIEHAAAEAGVSRIVYLGGLHPSDAELSPHLRSRVEVGEVFLDGPVPAIVLQAGVVIGSGSASFEMIRHLTERLPYMPAPKWVRNRIQPIAIRDVLHYLLGAARVQGDVNRTFDIGGPDVLRYGQMMNGYAVEAGLKQRPIASLPLFTPNLASLWVSLVTPVPAAIARPLVGSLQNECVVKEHDIDDVIPQPGGGLTGYREAVRLALSRLKDDLVETSWQDSPVVGAPSGKLPSDPDWSGRTVYTDARESEVNASPEAVWDVIEGIGGENGWHAAPLLWSIRGWMDRLVGGVGLRRGRRSRTRLVVGDAVDWWRVESIDPGRLLVLRAEMRVPGLAWLELGVTPDGDHSRYTQRAIFFPKGLWGRLYWLSVLPFHGFIFSRMSRDIGHQAESA